LKRSRCVRRTDVCGTPKAVAVLPSGIAAPTSIAGAKVA
jgi:hypothetical protein